MIEVTSHIYDRENHTLEINVSVDEEYKDLMNDAIEAAYEDSEIIDIARSIWDQHYNYQYGVNVIEYRDFIKLVEDSRINFRFSLKV